MHNLNLGQYLPHKFCNFLISSHQRIMTSLKMIMKSDTIYSFEYIPHLTSLPLQTPFSQIIFASPINVYPLLQVYVPSLMVPLDTNVRFPLVGFAKEGQASVRIEKAPAPIDLKYNVPIPTSHIRR